MCRKKCPNCKHPLEIRPIFRTAFSVADHEIICKSCSKRIQVEWTKAMGFMMMPVLLIMATLFRDLEIHLIRDLLIAFCIYVPSGIALALCMVPIKTITQSNTKTGQQ